MSETTAVGDTIVSVIIPTRNRPDQLHICLDGISSQIFKNYEVLIVDDGSSSANGSVYQDLIRQYGEKFQYLSVNPAGSHGAGPSMARNFGISQAKGKYLAFCDDDDFWCSADHLKVAVDALESTDADLYYANMNILSPAGEVVQAVHMRDIFRKAEAAPAIPSLSDVHLLSRAIMLSGANYAHLNITVVARELALKVGGFWNYSTYSEDVDFFVRVSDQAKGILYRSTLCASHNAPEKRPQRSVSNSIDLQDKRLLELSTNLHTLLSCQSAEAGQYVKSACSNILKEMARETDGRKAFIFAKQALAYRFGWKWSLYTMYLGVKSILNG